MVEKDFAIALVRSLLKCHPRCVHHRPNDARTIGLPDIYACMPPDGTLLVVEAKSIRPLLSDPMDPGRRDRLLHHPFSGPQISWLRSYARVGAQAWGIVRISGDTAVRIPPENIPASGNLTHAELLAAGQLVRRANGIWPFWDRWPSTPQTTGEADEHALAGSGHRDDPRERGSLGLEADGGGDPEGER